MLYTKQHENRTSFPNPVITYNLIEDKLQTQQGLIDLSKNIQTFEDYMFNNPQDYIKSKQILWAEDTSKNICTIDYLNLLFTTGDPSNGYYVIDGKYIKYSTYSSKYKIAIANEGTKLEKVIIHDDGSIEYTDSDIPCIINDEYIAYSGSIHRLSDGLVGSCKFVKNYVENINELDILLISSDKDEINVYYSDSNSNFNQSFPLSKASIASIIDKVNKTFKLITVTTDVGDGTPGVVIRIIENYDDIENISYSQQVLEVDASDMLFTDSIFTSTANGGIVLLHEFKDNKYITVQQDNTFYVFLFDEVNNKLYFKDKTTFSVPGGYRHFQPIYPNYTEGFLVSNNRYMMLIRFTPDGWKYYGEIFYCTRLIVIGDDIYYAKYSYNSDGSYDIYKEKLTQIDSFDIVFEKSQYYYDQIHKIDTHIKLLKSNITDDNYRLKLTIVSDNAIFTEPEKNELFIEVTPTQTEVIIPVTIISSGNVNIKLDILEKFSNDSTRLFNVSSKIKLSNTYNVTVTNTTDNSEG